MLLKMMPSMEILVLLLYPILNILFFCQKVLTRDALAKERTFVETVRIINLYCTEADKPVLAINENRTKGLSR